jgi:hypothetical protein
MSGRWPGRTLPCPHPQSRGGDVRPTGRADVRCPGVRCPGVRCNQVSGRTGLRCPRRYRRAVRAALDLEWLGAAGRPRVGRSGSTCRRGPRAAWSPAGIGPDGKGWCGVGRAGSHEGRPSPRAAAWLASRLRRRLTAGPTRRWSGAGAGRVVGEPGMEQVLTGPRRASWAGHRRGADHGPGPGGGDHPAWSLGEGWPRSSSSGRPTRFGGEQLAAAARPRRMRRAVCWVLADP